ncbi:glycoside hydrolase family 43 protein [Hymenobacter convexus]|uniref:glycoside hydrolase family 43 protein n=1 Tax=Hymenobacter sp. CA1UV-4 TaxID=3063782 RepID=UPI002712C38D|nr:glycoside hydrolase family 43 protein [Hymenobacter sp. CA1UV-4]MDO7849967.1 glycoside hydrolase family 43 protein [Hymenobacter sp. CA1UV-4]
MKKTFLTVALLAAAAAAQAQKRTAFEPGQTWPDNKGTHLNAHGGGVLYDKGRYYLFGEHKIAGGKGNSAQVGVHCYSSQDLYNWQDEGIALQVAPAGSGSEIEQGSIIERPKVVFNKKTGKYVMWFHLELKGQGYAAARTAVAVSDRATGPYAYVKSFRPGAGQWPLGFQEAWKQPVPGEKDLKWWTPDWTKAVAEGLFIRRDFAPGQMARDMTVFVDDDGKAYNIHSSEDNLTLHVAELTPDYQGFTGRWNTIAPAGHNEAPALCKRNGKYYLITSGCTGWDPNAARSFVASSIWGPWKQLDNPATGPQANITYNSQSTYILPVAGRKDAFIFLADRWTPKNPIDGGYIWLPLSFEGDQPRLQWADRWDLGVFDAARAKAVAN